MGVLKEVYQLTNDNNTDSELYDEITEKLKDFEIR